MSIPYVTVERLQANRLRLVAPVTATSDGMNDEYLYVADQPGKVWRLNIDDPRDPPVVFADVSKWIDRLGDRDTDKGHVGLNPYLDERGLLGLVIHPEFKDNGRFFMFFSAHPYDVPHDLVLNNDGAFMDVTFNSIGVLVEFRAPWSPDQEPKFILGVRETAFNHNGGSMAIEPVEFKGGKKYTILYLGVGDGGEQKDPYGRAQRNKNPHGKILQINVDNPEEWASPKDLSQNAFGAGIGILAKGFRNPWGITLGSEYQLIVPDAGHNQVEEINVIDQEGGNYGWPFREGSRKYEFAPSSPELETLIDPVFEYGHDEGVAVIGGRTIPSKNGDNWYVFGDFGGDIGPGMAGKEASPHYPSIGRTVWAIPEPIRSDDVKTKNQRLLLHRFPPGTYIKGFGEGSEFGVIYVLTGDTIGPDPRAQSGAIYRLVSPDPKLNIGDEIGHRICEHKPPGAVKVETEPPIDPEHGLKDAMSGLGLKMTSNDSGTVHIISRNPDTTTDIRCSGCAKVDPKALVGGGYVTSFSPCSECGLAVYCSKDCEEGHKDNHWADCQTLIALRPTKWGSLPFAHTIERLSRDDVQGIFRRGAKDAKDRRSGIRKFPGTDRFAFTRMWIAVYDRHTKKTKTYQTHEDAWEGSESVAKGKAYTASAFSSSQNTMSTRALGSLTQPGGPLWNIGNSNVERGGLVEFPGGLPLYKEGQLVGGVGVSGDLVDVDEEVTKAARGEAFVGEEGQK